MHVGLESDRGGNTIELEHAGDTTNLHSFWDTDAIALAELSLDDYVRDIAALARSADNYVAGIIDARRGVRQQAMEWARESLSLRPMVYDFDRDSEILPRAYLRFAEWTTRTRLALAARRLAQTLNAAFCE